MRRIVTIRGRARSGDRGAIIVEFALVLPIIVLLLLGTIEFGMAWKDQNQLERAVQTAGRTLGSAGSDRFADYEALRSLDSQLSAMRASEIRKVIVYRSTGTDGTVPADCLAIAPTGSKAGIEGVCNVYGPSQVAQANPIGFGSTGGDPPSCTGSAWDEEWCPADRVRTTPTPDQVGMYVEISYDTYTGLFDLTELTLAASAVFQAEPSTASLGG